MSCCGHDMNVCGRTVRRGRGGIGGADAAEVSAQTDVPSTCEPNARLPAASMAETSPANTADASARLSRRPRTAIGPTSSSGRRTSG
jgi:hypothetical protein